MDLQLKLFITQSALSIITGVVACTIGYGKTGQRLFEIFHTQNLLILAIHIPWMIIRLWTM